jgi:hypothetical protein
MPLPAAQPCYQPRGSVDRPTFHWHRIAQATRNQELITFQETLSI